MHVSKNRYKFLMVFIEFWCLTLHCSHGHEFNPSTEKKVNQGVFFDDEVMCICVSLCVSMCVHMCTLSP